MREAQMGAEEIASQFIGRCRAGFTSEHHWQTWLKKNERAIAALPRDLRDAVLLAHDQATAREFSR